MENLVQMHCSRVKKDTPRLNQNELDNLEAQLPGWQVIDKDNILRLEKVFRFENFNQAMSFTHQIAQLANEEDHHPAILTEWGKVTVSWWTHLIKSLSLNDLIMSAKTDSLYGDRNGNNK